MLKKILLISLVIVGVSVLLIPNGFDYFLKIPEEGQKITKELTDPAQDDGQSWADNFQKAFAYVGEKIEGLAFSANVFLTKQSDNKTSQIEEEVFYGKITGQKADTALNGISGSGGSANNIGKQNQGNTLTVISTSSSQNPVTILPIANDGSFNTLSLITKKQSDNRVSMKYDDTSGKTINVIVQIRNEEQTIFSGQFFSSSFETIILDASATPHFIDLVVEHAVYGRLSATAFIPQGSNDSVIYGIFAKN
jgi:hypothetical protein